MLSHFNRPNFGRGRQLSYSTKQVVPRIHISVKERIEHKKNLGFFGKYEPRAKWKGYPAEDPSAVIWEF